VHTYLVHHANEASHLSESQLADELGHVIGTRSSIDLAARLHECTNLLEIAQARGLANIDTPRKKARFLQEWFTGLAGGAAEGRDRNALIWLVQFADYPKARDRRSNAASALGHKRDTQREQAGAERYHERTVLRHILAGLLINAHHAEDQLRELPVAQFPEWLMPWSEGLSSWPSVGPSDRIRTDRTLDDGAVLYVVQHPATHPDVRFRELLDPPKYNLPSDLEEEIAARTDELVALGGRDNPKVSVDRVQLPQLDPNLLTIDFHQDKWTATKAFHDVIRIRPDARAKLSPWAADLSPDHRWPNILCLHGIMVLQHDGQPFVVWTQRQTKDPDRSTFYPGAWSCSFDEQIHPGETYREAARRSLREEMVGAEPSTRIDAPLIAVVLEQSILNLALVSYSFWPDSWSAFLDAYRLRTDPSEHYQVAAFPLNRDALQLCAQGSEIPRALRHDALLTASPELFHATDNWILHPTSLTRLALALWVTETIGLIGA
jgi:hypothetical protein